MAYQKAIEELRAIGRKSVENGYRDASGGRAILEAAKAERLNDGDEVIGKAKAEGRALLASEQRRIDKAIAEAGRDQRDARPARRGDSGRRRSCRATRSKGAGARRWARNCARCSRPCSRRAARLRRRRSRPACGTRSRRRPSRSSVGATVITTDKAELAIPKIVSDPAANWIGEGGSPSARPIRSWRVVAIPKKLAAIVRCPAS